MALRLVIGEDNYLVREGLHQLLEAVPEVEVCAVCVDMPSLEAAIEAHDPDVVLTDIRMPPTNTNEGVRLSAILRDTRPRTGVVALTQYADPEYAIELLSRGADGRAYLLKERVLDLDHLLSAIREVASGGSVIDPKIVEVLIAARSKKAESPLATLTPREKEVLAAVAQGKNNAAIQEELFHSERALEKHIHSIFSKLGLSEEQSVHRRVKAALIYLADQHPDAGAR